MIRLRIFKSARNKAKQEYDEDNLPHGTNVPNELVLPLTDMDSIVCADS